LLALTGQFLDRNQLLLDGNELGPQITAELHEIGLLRRERLLHQPDGGHHGVLLRRPCSVTLGDLGLQRLDLELDFPDVAFERAPGKEPQA
jgi:hypothetical protein